MKISTFAFIGLCMAAPVFQLLERYGLFHWQDDVVFPLLLASIFLWLVLFGWSILSVRHHRVRAVAGALICTYCLWQSFQNGQIIY